MLFSGSSMTRRLRWPIWAASVAILSGQEGRAFAGLEYHLSALGSLGASDNPRMQAADQARADGFVSAMGQVDLEHVGPVAQGRLSYGIMALSWFRSSQSSSLTHSLRLAYDVQIGPATKLALFGAATLAQLTTVDTTAPTDTQAAGPRPIGDQKFLGVEVGDTLTSQIGGSWRLDQGLDARWYRPLGSDVAETQNRGATLTLDLYRVWARDVVGLRTRGGIVTAGVLNGETTQPDAPVSSTFTGELMDLTLSWQREWTPDFRHTVAAGVSVLHTDKSRWLPNGSTSLLWRSSGHDLELRASSGADFSIYVGTVYRRHLVGLRGVLPLDRLERLRATVDTSLEHDSAEATSSSSGGSATVGLVRATIGWSLWDTFVLALEYELRDQHASTPDTVVSLFPTFRRQTAMFTIAAKYPPSGPR